IIEEDLEILNFRFKYDNFLMWPLIRSLVLKRTLMKTLNWNPAISVKKKFNLSDLFHYIFTTLANNPLSRNIKANNDILVISSGVTVKTDNNKYTNRLYDYFAFEFENNTLIIEDSRKEQFRYNRPRIFPNVKCHDYILVKTFLQSRFKRHNKADLETIDSFIDFLKQRIPLQLEEDVWKRAKWLLRNYARMLPYFYDNYTKLFSLLKPKIVFIDNASYGQKSYILKVAHKLNIITGEVQHGIIHKNHYSYKYFGRFFDSEYKEYLPKYLLSYGEYWSSTCMTPTKVITVGNPYLTEHKNNHLPEKKTGSRKNILFIAVGLKYKQLVDFIDELNQNNFLSDYDVVLRPHPGEKPYLEERYGSLKKHKINISTSVLYDDLATADYIVSLEPTTVLFEAMIFNKIIIVHDSMDVSYLLEPGLFSTFKTSDDLIKIINSTKYAEYNTNYFWDKDWRSNYRKFIEGIL
ncbi:MAG: hypothetical protein KKF78_11125, partial [Candidatus Omnitrophica bacterium]|nr:hypothetical protein [Candidatus Omnitrophota bacterium]